MALHFIFGPSGSGKSHYIYNKMISESEANPNTGYILLVPEQYSMALQKKIVTLSPSGGTMNIDVIGFNRLAYRVFDELNVRTAKVLEDFGKTMLIRQAAGTVKERLNVYGGCLDKPGFIDEVKSLMSEMYQYDISRKKLDGVIELLKEENGETLLLRKLTDMKTIFDEFAGRLSDGYIVAEQLTELLADYAEKSDIIRKSVIVMDGFTGFTPIQLKLISKLMRTAIDVHVVLTIDRKSYDKKIIAEHELFYLTRQTGDRLLDIAESLHVLVSEDIFIDKGLEARWKKEDSALRHLENNLFRYPYSKYTGDTNEITITEYETPRKELLGVARDIRRLVTCGGYRYRDIAVITGDLEKTMQYAEQIFPMLDIPYFIDYSRPVKNNPYVDAIGHALGIISDNFSYDSVFSFLKSGVVTELCISDTEQLENYCLAKGVRGVSGWRKQFDGDTEELRLAFMELILPFYEKIHGSHVKVKDYVDAIYGLMDRLEYQRHMEETKGLYEKLCEVLDKMLQIMPEDETDIDDFAELLDLGLKDITLGMIPNMLDMVIVGDITRTRIDSVRALYIVGTNDGIIPKKGTPAQIISDREKERLSGYSLVLAPTEKLNGYIEQFYLYLNMTKPSDMLSVSYSLLNCNNDELRPSYIVSRIKNIFPDIKVRRRDGINVFADTYKSGVWTLTSGINRLMSGDSSCADELLHMLLVYIKGGDDGTLNMLENAFNYSNVPQSLTSEVFKLIRLKLMTQSVSRLEKYANCAYAYFLQYTIGLSERKEKKIDNRDIGTILHAAMEKLYRHVHDELDNDWQGLGDDARDTLIAEYVNESFEAEYEGVDTEDGRYDYLKDSLVRIGKRTAKVLSEITCKDSLKPEFFEYRFSEDFSYGDGGVMTLKGIVDRADVHYSEEEKKLVVRVIDYKSGMHEFKINELYEGLQLQLAMYTNIMLELFGKEYDGADIVPEGMYYYTMRDPYVEAEGADEAEAKRAKELKLKGLSGEDADKFQLVLNYARDKALSIAGNIAAGDIDKYPVMKNGKACCEYCVYSDVCRFDDRYGGNKYHYMKYRDSDRDAVYGEIEAMYKGGGHDVD